jgi:S-disulfanyl-L-cysteine oxidoreductase SoxD
MCSSRRREVRVRDAAAVAVAALLAALAPAPSASAAPAALPDASRSYPGVGRAATSAELQAWDIDVRPDFKGLPPGAGSVVQGQAVWEAKCASCHGVFGESGEVFNPIVGGTTADDVRSGRAARLTDSAYPGRTTLMKLSTVSTLWDYIRRAMPWNQPKSLAVDEVYAVSAYILNLGGVVPDDFVLSDRTMAEAQRRLPNRDGMSTAHALWPGPEFGVRTPDVQASACMRDCAAAASVASFLPDYARNAHGNLADQNRLVGPQRGARTAAAPADAVPATAASPPSPPPPRAAPTALLDQHACSACHGLDSRIVGPAFKDIAKKYAARDDAVGYLVQKIRSGGSGVWGAVPMPSQAIGEPDARTIARWLAEAAGSATAK